MRTDVPTRIIAEAGVNHNGDIDLALRLIDVAAEAGADIVKFQTFRTTHLANRSAPKAAYQAVTTGRDENQFEMLRKLELSDAQHETLIAHAKSKRIEFLSTPFDRESLRLLTARFGMNTVKVASGEINNAPFLLDIARLAKTVIVSTGMSTLGDVEAALGVLAFGLTMPADARPSRAAFARAFASAEGQAALRERVTLLHCTTEYPAPIDEVNLRAMATLADAFGLPVGYSDHTQGIHIALAAVALGACIIEKHFTLDRALPGPDHAASLEPEELRELVRTARLIARARGDGVKRPTASEWGNREIARKSLVALQPIAAGESLTATNVGCKRPGTGLDPFEYWAVLEHRASRAYQEGELIDE